MFLTIIKYTVCFSPAKFPLIKLKNIMLYFHTATHYLAMILAHCLPFALCLYDVHTQTYRIKLQTEYLHSKQAIIYPFVYACHCPILFDSFDASNLTNIFLLQIQYSTKIESQNHLLLFCRCRCSHWSY